MKITLSFLTSALLLSSCGAALAASGAHHAPGIFAGFTNAKDETEFTYGFEYEYKFNRHWGLGAVYEKTNDAHHGDGVTVKLGSLYYHPNADVRLGLGFGEEKIGGAHPFKEDLYRVSASYDFHLGDFALAPTIAVDFVDGDEAYVLGVALLRPF